MVTKVTKVTKWLINLTSGHSTTAEFNTDDVEAIIFEFNTTGQYAAIGDNEIINKNHIVSIMRIDNNVDF